MNENVTMEELAYESLKNREPEEPIYENYTNPYRDEMNDDEDVPEVIRENELMELYLKEHPEGNYSGFLEWSDSYMLEQDTEKLHKLQPWIMKDDEYIDKYYKLIDHKSNTTMVFYVPEIQTRSYKIENVYIHYTNENVFKYSPYGKLRYQIFHKESRIKEEDYEDLEVIEITKEQYNEVINVFNQLVYTFDN